jgi:hypothetical protein
MSELKRPRDRAGQFLTVATVNRDDSPPALSTDLATWLFPAPLDAFLQESFRNAAFAVKVHPKHRERRLEELSEAMDNFHPVKMLEASNSEAIHVWMKTPGGELKSIRTDAAQAKACYDAGHALYFRGSEYLESTYLPPFAEQLGFGFAARFRDGNRRSEIETFVARPGHLTTWHYDFQENFTVQLKGAKKWSFYKGKSHPYRACALHFNGHEHQRTLNTQLQVARVDEPLFDVPADIDENCESVVLQEGDVLYHPAGMWHQVEVVGDSPALSINLSFFPATWAEVVRDALFQSLLSDAALRQRVAYADRTEAHAKLAAALKAAADKLAALTPGDILPAAALSERGHGWVMWNDDGTVSADAALPGPVPRSGVLRRNPLAVLSRTLANAAFAVALKASGPSNDEEDSDSDASSTAEEITELDDHVRYDLAVNFVAEDGALNAPAVTATIFVAEKHVSKFDRLCALDLTPLTVERLSTLLPLDVIGVLVQLGFFTPVKKH